MKRKIKLAALVAATGLVAASSQAAGYNGDLIVGFTSASGNDFVYDLGAALSLDNGSHWDLSSYLGSFTLTSVNWGVIGDNTTSHIVWTTTDGSYTPRDISGHTDLIQNIDNPTASIYNNFATAGAGNSATVDATQGNSWNIETLNPTLGTDYYNSFENPNTQGEVSDYLYELSGYNTDPQVLGSFSLDSGGVLHYDPVPEPSTMGLLSGAGLLMVALRNKFRRA